MKNRQQITEPIQQGLQIWGLPDKDFKEPGGVGEVQVGGDICIPMADSS